ncbi:hypothetical protein HNR05_000700 [Leifsonia psychrotolerans]|uniref:Uncharacterized protein n=1 Tax=Glaciibacter psychrotolerans TaxID=670054 RepID=A0A7Z0EC62_9MICO|nr:hypothetical protein [Leifsonia psychrotolerans]NYJ18909.1 hypothetical protein [Leifsonia psychrotolerans]
MNHIRNPVANLSTYSNTRRTAPVCAQVVDGLSVHAELLGEFAGGEHGLEAKPGKPVGVHNS